MKKNIKTKNEHCCKLMEKALDDSRIEIDYWPVFREYSVSTRSIAIQLIFYCPFCGSKLPKELRDEWGEILENEYNIDDPFCDQDSEKIPDEFKSDLWWIKRNL